MDERTISIAVAIDDEYARPLLVAIRSSFRALSPGWRIRLFVLEYQISTATKRWFEQALAARPVAVEWVAVDLEPIRGYWPASDQEARITIYARLYLGDALPADVERVLYLDADLLIEADLVELWTSPFDGMAVQAVQDAYFRRLHLPRLSAIKSNGVAVFDESTRYFNAGVMLIELNCWRRERFGSRAAELLWIHGGALRGRDQDALNCALQGRWKALDFAWNYHELPKAHDPLPVPAREPAIVHYIGCKPWEPDCVHRQREDWLEAAREAGLAL